MDINMDEYHAELRSRLAVVSAGRAERRRAGVFDDVASVPRLFAGKDVLITGGSGFLGRVLVEKILRSCPDVGTLFLLLRPKRGVKPQDRIQDVVDVPLFDQLRREQPDALGKLVAVPGDCSDLCLGLSAEDHDLLQDRVSFVFHGAASVRFDDPVLKAVLLNTRGAREVTRLCSGMRKLEALVHISTAFTNINQRPVQEKLYPTQLDWRQVIQCVDNLATAEAMDHLGPKLLGFHKNTYTFSKALAEQVMGEAAATMPVIIVRPAIVIGANSEPLAGWLDNVNSPAAIWAAINMGVLRTTPLANSNVLLDILPVDLVVKATILAAWCTATEQNLGEVGTSSGCEVSPCARLPVVNFVITDVHPVTCSMMYKIFIEETRQEVPFTSAIRYPFLNVHFEHRLAHALVGFFYHTLFGICMDLVLRLANQKPRLLKVYRKIAVTTAAVSPISNIRFSFETAKFWKMQLLMHPDDEKSFDFAIEALHPRTDCRNQIKGILEYAFKEKFDRKNGLRHINRLFWLEAAFYSGLLAMLVYFLKPTFYFWK